MAIEDKKEPCGIRLIIEDYPYAIDGLDVWTAINTYVHAYCTHFYPSNPTITSDAELQSWWVETTQVGHGDTDPSSWPILDSIETLTRSLTTIIWIASALHASVNFGQYAYAGYPLNRPTKCRKFIPLEGTSGFADFLKNPDQYFLEMMNDRFTTTLGVALIEVLSMHIGDEVYLGRREDGWIDDEEVVRIYKEFGEELRRVEQKIKARNQDEKLKNRCGPAKVPYMLMYPDTGNMGEEKGMTEKGIPNSVSI